MLMRTFWAIDAYGAIHLMMNEETAVKWAQNEHLVVFQASMVEVFYG